MRYLDNPGAALRVLEGLSTGGVRGAVLLQSGEEPTVPGGPTTPEDGGDEFDCRTYDCVRGREDLVDLCARYAAAKRKAKEAKEDDGLWFLWDGIARRLFEEIWAEVGKQKMCCGGR